MILIDELSQEASNWSHGTELRRRVSEKLELVKPILVKKYGEIADAKCHYKETRISAMYYLLGDVNGKRILDLGSGSALRDTTRNSWDLRLYEPWICRILHELGAKPIGIDSKHDSSEEFEGYRIDLSSHDSLKQFPDKSIDLAYAFSLFDSPSLHLVYGSNAGKELFHCMMFQLERVVKDEGYFLFEATGSGREKIFR